MPEDNPNPIFPLLVIEDLTLSEVLALMHGNDVPMDLQVKIRTILESKYMEDGDTEETRQRAAETIASEIVDKLESSPELDQDLKPGVDLNGKLKKVLVKHVRKLINAAFDMPDSTDDDKLRFSKRLRKLMRWALGDVMDHSNNCYKSGIQSTLKLIRSNLSRGLQSGETQGMEALIPIATDQIMQRVTSSYQTYREEKRRDEELNGPEEQSEEVKAPVEETQPPTQQPVEAQ